MMQIGQRDVKTIARALFQKQHYIALGNMMRLYPNSLEILGRYLFAYGSYPSQVHVRTPLGQVSATLYSHDDLLTLNEIFCREDYDAGFKAKVIVDIGSNIGLSALYFLTRNTTSFVYLYEPVPMNIKRLKHNLASFQQRYSLCEGAVACHQGKVEFGTEPTGRYGAIGKETGVSIEVDCFDINAVLANILGKEGRIDILKIDIEGEELSVIRAIDNQYLPLIGRIYAEANPRENPLQGKGFVRQQYGSVLRLLNTHHKREGLLLKD